MCQRSATLRALCALISGHLASGSEGRGVHILGNSHPVLTGQASRLRRQHTLIRSLPPEKGPEHRDGERPASDVVEMAPGHCVFPVVTDVCMCATCVNIRMLVREVCVCVSVHGCAQCVIHPIRPLTQGVSVMHLFHVIDHIQFIS